MIRFLLVSLLLSVSVVQAASVRLRCISPTLTEVLVTTDEPLGAYSISIAGNVHDVWGGHSVEFGADPIVNYLAAETLIAAWQAFRLDGPIGDVSIAQLRTSGPVTLGVRSLYNTSAQPLRIDAIQNCNRRNGH